MNNGIREHPLFNKIKIYGEDKMNVKSRYEVIADLESKKRELIKEKNGLNDTLLEKEKELTIQERQKDDNIIIMDRKLEDIQEDIDSFKETMDEKEETIEELIESVDDSLERFNKISKDKP